MKALVDTFHQEKGLLRDSCGTSFQALVPTCSHFTFRTLSDFATSVYLIVTFSTANTHNMRWPSEASDIEISFHTLCTCLQIVREIVQPEKGSKLANLLPNFKQIVGCETWSRSGEKYFKQQQVVSIFPWCLDQEMTSYTFLLPQSISWQVAVRILLRAPRVVITRARGG